MINGVAGIVVYTRETINFKVLEYEAGRGQSKWKPLYTLPKVAAPTLSFSGCQVEAPFVPGVCWSRLWDSSSCGHPYCLEEKSSRSQFFMAGGLVPPGHHQQAFKMCFGWGLNGEVRSEGKQTLTHFCCVVLNNKFREIWKWLVGKTVPWCKKNAKSHDVLAGGMLMLGYRVPAVSHKFHLQYWSDARYKANAFWSHFKRVCC